LGWVKILIKLLSIKNTFVYLVVCKIPRTEENFLRGTSHIRRTVIAQCKKADPQMAHLVFSDTQTNASKNQMCHFSPTHGRTARQLFKHFLS
jgi:hypothetical protein